MSMSAYLQRTRALATAALLAFAVCFGLAFATQAYAESSGGGDTQQLAPAQGLTAQAGEWTGAGTEADPYVISDAAGLQKLADDVNSGTNGRTSRYGDRKSIAARNFLRNAGEPALVKAVDTLSNLIDSELQNILNKKK